nr:hypothetical protein [Tanacetum cinerariifolium]
LEKIIIDLEDEVSENVSSESKNQTENHYLVVEKEYDKEENPKVIAPVMFKLNVSQCVSPISISKSSCDYKNVEIKLKRKRHLDTFSSVRRPKHSSVVWMKKWSSNTSNVGETSSAYMCNDAMNVSCDSRMNDFLDDNNFFIFDDERVKISPVSKMPFRKKPCDSMNVHSKSNMIKSLPRTKQEEKRIEEEQAASARYWKIPACCDDDDYDYAITPEETKNSLSMGDEHLDTTPATKSDEVMKSSVEDLISIPSESKGTPDTMCDVHLVNNPTLLEAKDHFKIVTNSNDDISSSDDDSLYNENIDTTTHSDISLSEYDSFIFDFTHEEFADELAHIISPPEYDCFYFWNLPDLGELMSVLNSGIRENLSTTRVNLPIEDDHSPLLAYVVWIFLAYLTYLVIPPYLHPFGNEDTIFDPCITINRFCLLKPSLSHRYGAFKKFNTYRSHLNEWPMIINGKNTHILDVLLFHFYPP